VGYINKNNFLYDIYNGIFQIVENLPVLPLEKNLIMV